MTNVRSIRLARALSRIFQTLRVLCIIGLLILVPTMLFAWFAPGSIPANTRISVAGAATSIERPALAGTLMLFANGFLVAAILLLGRLRAMVQTIETGAPFTMENVARLHFVAWTMGALFLGKLVVLTLTSIADNRFVVGAQLDFGLLLGMLVVLVLAEVFREGVRLREESEGTI